MSPTASIEAEGIQNLLLGCYAHLGAVKVGALLGRLPLELLQFLLISPPLVCNRLSTLEAANRDDHLF